MIMLKNHTTCHNVAQGFLVRKTSTTTNNGKSRLQNPKGSFYIFSGSFLHLCKFNILSSFGIFYALHKCTLRGVNTICKPLCVPMLIHREVASWSITTSKSSKQIRPLQHIDIIE